MRHQIIALILLLLTCMPCLGQRVKWKSFRLTEENDFFNIKPRGIDRYYTQGARFEFIYQASKATLFEKLMIPASETATNNYALGFTQEIYTPDQQTTFGFVGDRPYAGAIYLSQSLESMDTARRFRLTTSLSAGVVGPAAFAEWTQLGVHNIIKNDLAVGWNTQVRNDLFLNYFLKAEKALTKQLSLLRIEVKGEVNFGTALISLVPGINFELGNWHNLSRKFSWQIFFRPEVRMVLFNALLQGGVLNESDGTTFYSQYLIKKIQPLVYAHSLGFQVRYKRLGLLYRQVNMTSEFHRQLPHYYSTLMFTFPLNRTFRFSK